MKYLAIALAFTALMHAQQPSSAPMYCSTSGDVTAPTTFTIQVPSTAVRAAYLMSALVTTTTASTFTQAVNGTAATTTAGTVTQTPSAAPVTASQARSFTVSNVGAGTAIAGKITTPAAAGLTIDLKNSGDYVVLKPGAASNYSITVAGGGTANVTVCWKEQ